MAEDIVRLEKNGLTVDVSPLGGAILAATWNGIPFLAPTPSPGLASQVLGAEACFPLVPFGNRIKHNAFRFEGRDYALKPNTADPLVLHGDGWLQRWQIAEQEPHRIILRYGREADARSPFAYDVTQTVLIDNDSIRLALTVTNRAAQSLPFGLGFHPYFPRTPATRLSANVERYWSERENHLPGKPGSLPPDLNLPAGTGLPSRWLNNALDGWDGKAFIEWPEKRLALFVEASPELRHLFIYSPSAEDGFVCLEPMSHQANAFDEPESGGLVTLQPGAQMSGHLTLRCVSTAPPVE